MSQVWTVHILEILWMPPLTQTPSTQHLSDPSQEFLYRTTMLHDGNQPLPFLFPGWELWDPRGNSQYPIIYFSPYRQDYCLKLLPHWSNVIRNTFPASPLLILFVEWLSHWEAVILQIDKKCHQTAHLPLIIVLQFKKTICKESFNEKNSKNYYLEVLT